MTIADGTTYRGSTDISQGAFKMSLGHGSGMGRPAMAGRRTTIEYWAILAALYPSFLLIAALRRLMPRAWFSSLYYSSCHDDRRALSIHAEALSRASTAATYAFMG